MIAYIALIFSILNTLMWILFAITIRRLFNKLVPLFVSMGIMQSQNLTTSAISGSIKAPLK